MLHGRAVLAMLHSSYLLAVRRSHCAVLSSFAPGATPPCGHGPRYPQRGECGVGGKEKSRHCSALSTACRPVKRKKSACLLRSVMNKNAPSTDKGSLVNCCKCRPWSRHKKRGLRSTKLPPTPPSRPCMSNASYRPKEGRDQRLIGLSFPS